MTKLRGALPYGLVILGLLQIIGYVLHIEPVRGLAYAYLTSPLPLVFSTYKGYETFALDFNLKIRTEDGRVTEQKVTPSVFGKFKGPFNRRNTYGVVFAFGPGMTSEAETRMWKSVFRHGFCNEGPLSKELGLTSPVEEAAMDIQSRSSNGQWTMKVNCHE